MYSCPNTTKNNPQYYRDECNRRLTDLPLDINLNLRLHLDNCAECSSNIRAANGGRTPLVGSSKKVGPVPPPKPSQVKKGMFQDPSSKSDSSDAVEVFCRIRPLKDMTEIKCVSQVKENVIEITGKSGNACYSFKKVLNETTEQKTVFQEVCLPIIKDCLDGKNGLVFTYGVTGSGKTHTLTGDPQNPGILPRTLDTLFNSIQGKQLEKYTVKNDGQNGFYVQNERDALHDRQQTVVKNTPSTPLTGQRSSKQRNQEYNQIKQNNKWAARTTETSCVEPKAGLKFAVFVSYVEVYNNYIYDLLDDCMESKQSKVIREDSKKRVFVQGCQEEEITCASEGIQVLLKGLLRRKIAQTVLNTESSRSHSVFSIRVVATNEESNLLVLTSQLSLVDLAGSERTGRTGAKGERLREAGNINNSLMSLRSCLDILRDNQKNKNSPNKIVPYRDSKITHLFKAYFEGEGSVKMIICINPSRDEFDETIQVLKFAEVSQEVMIRRGVDIDWNARVVTPSSVTNFGPPAPSAVFEVHDDQEETNFDQVIPAWITWLEDHKKTREEKTLKLLDKQQDFREHLTKVEQENLLLKNVNQVLKKDLSAREEQVQKLEADLNQRQHQTSMAERKAVSLEKHIESLEAELKKHREAASLLETEKKRLKENHEQNLRLEQQRIRDHYETRMQTALREIRRESCLKQEKLLLVQRILNGDSSSVRQFQDTFDQSPIPDSTHVKEVNGTNGTSPRKTRSGRASTKSVTQEDNSNLIPIVCPLSPGNPVMNPRQRRSSSADKWLDHRPVGTIGLDTVLQPHFKKRKSVTSVKGLTSHDLNQSSHYALTTHVVSDPETGEVETRVFKADVIPSLVGGTHVVFNDVEKLTQEDPVSPEKRLIRKRTETPSTVTSSPVTHSTNFVTKRTRRGN